MMRLDPRIPQKDPQHLSKDMHVAAERHSHEEEPEADGIRPPERQEHQLVTEKEMPEMVDTYGQETSAAQVGRKA